MCIYVGTNSTAIGKITRKKFPFRETGSRTYKNSYKKFWRFVYT